MYYAVFGTLGQQRTLLLLKFGSQESGSEEWRGYKIELAEAGLGISSAAEIPLSDETLLARVRSKKEKTRKFRK